MKNYEILLWDVDDTLLDFLKSERFALTKCFKTRGLCITDELIELYSKINCSYWKRLERGEIDKKTVSIGRFETFFKEINKENIDVNAFQMEYQTALGSVFFFRDNADQLLKDLSKDFKQYLVTNGVSATQRSKLKLSGIDKIVDDIFISDELGYSKPQKGFFENCFVKIPNFHIEKALIIGDSLSSDMKGGNNAGIASCWYNPNKNVNSSLSKIDYEIHNLNEIKNIIYQ